jgi:hypothetical protein
MNNNTMQVATITERMRVPSSYGSKIYGEVKGHPRFKDGNIILTSRVIKDFGNIVVTCNTVYILKRE